MNAQDAIDLGREAIRISLLVGSPMLLAALVAGLVLGLLQTVTQVQEHAVAFVPKLIATVIVLSISLPWMISRLVQYSSEVISSTPGRL